MATWKYTTISVENTQVKAQAPVIISASRSTDIPAFYADWFFRRLEKGYSAWTNPFNGVKSYVSYEAARFIVFWSKNPRPLLDYLPVLRERGIGCYVQFTLNDYEKESLEKVPPLSHRIETFKMLVDRLGEGSVVWRFDPLILTGNISVDDLLGKVRNIGEQLKGYTEKLVFSYADIGMYRKVGCNLKRNGIKYHEWAEKQMLEFAGKLAALNRECGWHYTLATCGENIDLSRYGIEHNRCVDGDLIARLAWRDEQLMRFMGVEIKDMPVPDLFGETEALPPGAFVLPNGKYFMSAHKKDAGQRQACGCMMAKDIGEYNTCPHLCEYCYANANKQLALDNYARHRKNPDAETITGNK